MMTPSTILLKSVEFQLTVLTILLSLIAVVYWVKLFRHFSLSREEDTGWIWIFASVLMVLLLNLSSLLMVFSNASVYLGTAKPFKVDMTTLGFFDTFSRTMIAISTTIGAYLLYTSIGSRGNVKFKFTAIEPVAEDHSKMKAKYELEGGCGYLIEETPEGVPAMELFSDSVKHGVQGLCITRTYPPKLRDRYGLKKTPIIWLTREGGYKDSINPGSLIELSHLVKDFIAKSSDSIVLLDGIEYLILQNKFEEVLRLIQSIDDVVMQYSSRLLVSLDSSSLEERQLHLLRRELNAYNPRE
jgi:hypothetical protein